MSAAYWVRKIAASPNKSCGVRIVVVTIELPVIPEIDAARESGVLLQQLPELRSNAISIEKHSLLNVIGDAVFLRFASPAYVHIKLKPVLEVLLGCPELPPPYTNGLVADDST